MCFFYASSWLCVCLQNYVWLTDRLRTFMISECHFANLAGPCHSTEMRPHDPKSMCVTTLQFWIYFIWKSWKLLQSTSKIMMSQARTGRRPGAPSSRGRPRAPAGRPWCVCVFTLEIEFSVWNSKFKLNIYRTGKLSRYHSGTLHGLCKEHLGLLKFPKMVFIFCITSHKPFSMWEWHVPRRSIYIYI